LNVRGEDTDLFLRIFSQGFESWYSPAAVVHHVIPPERLAREYLCKLANVMAGGMAEIDRDHWGKALFPLVWLARLGQAALLLGPRLVWARVRRNEENTLGAYCRLTIARKYLEEGVDLIVGRCLQPMHATVQTRSLVSN
jgi:hypothetical protein